jgi:hypothetical protein
VAYLGIVVCWFGFQFVDLTKRAAQGILSYSEDGVYRSDYVAFYTVNKILCSPDKGRMYDHAVQKKWEIQVLGGKEVNYYITVENSPLVFALSMPFMSLPINASHWAWGTVSFLFGGAICYLLCFSAGQKNLLPVLIIFGIACSAPSHMEFEFGQVTYFMMGAVGGFFWCLLEQNDLAAGFFLSLCSVKYQLIPLLALATVPGRKFHSLIVMTVLVLLYIIITGYSWGWSNFLDYPHSLLDGDSTAPHRAMPCLRGLLCCFGVTPKIALYIDLIVLILAFLLLLVQGWKSKLQPLDGKLWCALLVTLTLLLTPHCFSNYSVLHGVTASLFLPEYFNSRFNGQKRATAIAWLLILSPILSWLAFAGLAFAIPEAFGYVSFNVVLASLLLSLLNSGVRRFVSS